MASGREVVAAAAIAPVGALVRALSTSAERFALGPSGPSSTAFSAQRCHQWMVSSSRSSTEAVE